MKTKNSCPFMLAEIEIFNLDDADIVTASPENGDPFGGEWDDFED